MNRRERVRAALKRQPVDRLPTDMWATREVWQRLFAHFGVDNQRDPDDLNCANPLWEFYRLKWVCALTDSQLESEASCSTWMET